MSWVERAVKEITEHGAVVRVTVIRADGSTPRESGAAMLVGAEHIRDTIGGGALELEAIAHARGLLAPLPCLERRRAGDITLPWQRDVRDFALGPSLGQCCGGHTRLLFEVLTARERACLEALARDADADAALVLRPLESGPPLEAVSSRKALGERPLAVTRALRDVLSGARPREAMLIRGAKGESAWFVEPLARLMVPLYVYGAGHVGRALVRVLQDLPFAVTWADTSASRFPDPLPAHAHMEAASDLPALAASSAGRRLPHRHDLLARARSGDLPCGAAAGRLRPSRPDRLGDQAGALREAPGRARHRPGAARAPNLPDRPAGTRRQRAQHDRRRGCSAAGTARNRGPRRGDQWGVRGRGRSPMTGPLLELQGITKRFPGVVANDDVTFSVGTQEIHALLGENGAGKSTLVKMIYGVMRPDEGVMRLAGEIYAPHKPSEAREKGVGMVFQHFSLFEGLTVAENIALGISAKLAKTGLRERIIAVSTAYGLKLDPDRRVGTLSVGERQRVEIVRCLLQEPKLLIMDEPTSVLTPQEIEVLFATLRRLVSEGCSILYISPQAGGDPLAVRPRHHPARRQGGGELRSQARDRTRPGRDDDRHHAHPAPARAR